MTPAAPPPPGRCATRGGRASERARSRWRRRAVLWRLSGRLRRPVTLADRGISLTWSMACSSNQNYSAEIVGSCRCANLAGFPQRRFIDISPTDPIEMCRRSSIAGHALKDNDFRCSRPKFVWRARQGAAALRAQFSSGQRKTGPALWRGPGQRGQREERTKR